MSYADTLNDAWNSRDPDTIAGHLMPGAADVEQSASDDELTLAGRGFNREVERTFQYQNPEVDFSWIDRMEKMVVSQDEIQKFLRDGGLMRKGGAP